MDTPIDPVITRAGPGTFPHVLGDGRIAGQRQHGESFRLECFSLSRYAGALHQETAAESQRGHQFSVCG